MFFGIKSGFAPLELELPWDLGISLSCRQRRRSSKGPRPEPRHSAGFAAYSTAAAHPYIFDFFLHVSYVFLN